MPQTTLRRRFKRREAGQHDADHHTQQAGVGFGKICEPERDSCAHRNTEVAVQKKKEVRMNFREIAAEEKKQQQKARRVWCSNTKTSYATQPYSDCSSSGSPFRHK